MPATDIISAQVIAADGEQKAARALKEASETISESSSAMQLRYLQVSSKLDSVSSLKPNRIFKNFIWTKYLHFTLNHSQWWKNQKVWDDTYGTHPTNWQLWNMKEEEGEIKSTKVTENGKWKEILFQTLYSISSEKNHTIVFPLPVDVLGNMMGGGGKGDKANVHAKGKETSEKKSLWSEENGTLNKWWNWGFE